MGHGAYILLLPKKKLTGTEKELCSLESKGTLVALASFLIHVLLGCTHLRPVFAQRQATLVQDPYGGGIGIDVVAFWRTGHIMGHPELHLRHLRNTPRGPNPKSQKK